MYLYQWHIFPITLNVKPKFNQYWHLIINILDYNGAILGSDVTNVTNIRLGFWEK